MRNLRPYDGFIAVEKINERSSLADVDDASLVRSENGESVPEMGGAAEFQTDDAERRHAHISEELDGTSSSNSFWLRLLAIAATLAACSVAVVTVVGATHPPGFWQWNVTRITSSASNTFPSSSVAPDKRNNSIATGNCTTNSTDEFSGRLDGASTEEYEDALPPLPGAAGAVQSIVNCTDDADLLRRSCIVEHVCHDARDNRWYLFAGGSNVTRNSSLCVGVACDDLPFVYPLPLPYDYAVLKPRVIPGPPPPADPAGVHWFGSAILQSRHYPENFFHAVTDDYFGLYWGLRRALRHPAYTPASPGGGYGGWGLVAPNTSAAAAADVVNVVDDAWPFDLPSTRIAARFHHVRYARPGDLHAEAAGAGRVCFRRMLAGTPGITTHRNAGAYYTPVRSWHDPINARTQRADVAAFARFFTARALAAAGEDPAAYAPPRRDTIVLLNRAGPARRIENLGELLQLLTDAEAARGDGGGYAVTAVDFAGMSDAEVLRLLQRAVALVGAHGAGLTNLLYMQPGALLLELVPAGSPRNQLFFSALAAHVGLRHRAMPAAGDFNGALTVDATAVRAYLDILLQDDDGRATTRRR